MSTGTALPEAAESAVSRSFIYKYLSLGFMMPEEGWWELVRNGLWARGIRMETEALESHRTAVDAVRRFSLEADKLKKNGDLEALKAEYTRLFVLPADSRAISYETEYTAAHPFIKSREISDIFGFYRAFGVGLSITNPDRADFIATELEFMHVLCVKETAAKAVARAEQDEVVRDAEAKFVRDHLGRWVRNLAVEIETLSPGSFYAALSRFAAAFVEAEAAFLNVVPEEAGKISAYSGGNDFCGPACPSSSPVEGRDL